MSKKHNPDNLTDEQVGVADGWRLLDEDEVDEFDDSKVEWHEIEAWDDGEWDAGYGGYVIDYTYRTNLSRAELRAKRGLPPVIIEEAPASNQQGINCVASSTSSACGTPSNIPDSGSRTNFATGAVRDSMAGKGLPSLIPPCAIRRIAQRFEVGAERYGRNNWTKGIPLTRYQDSTMRHLLAWAEGDTSEDHLGAAAWNVCAAMWTEQQIKDGKLPSDLMDLPYRK